MSKIIAIKQALDTCAGDAIVFETLLYTYGYQIVPNLPVEVIQPQKPVDTQPSVH